MLPEVLAIVQTRNLLIERRISELMQADEACGNG